MCDVVTFAMLCSKCHLWNDLSESGGYHGLKAPLYCCTHVLDHVLMERRECSSYAHHHPRRHPVNCVQHAALRKLMQIYAVLLQHEGPRYHHIQGSLRSFFE
jgi:hypothetical protein